MSSILQALSWVFDGIGTQLLALIIGAVCGGFAGYKIGVKKSIYQKQVAKDDAKQRQEGSSNIVCESADKVRIKSKVRQIQRAGDNADQVQIGEFKNE